MEPNAQIENKIDALNLGLQGYEQEAQLIFEEAQRAAALIPGSEFEEVFDAAPPLEFHHRYVQSLLTWIWYEVHENEVPLENLPLPLAIFFQNYEAPFATFWQQED